MIARRPLAVRIQPRINVEDYLAIRGLALSHALGIALFVSMFLDRVARVSLPFIDPIDIPILLLTAWLILDRRGRIGPVRVGWVDFLYLGFVAAQAFSNVYADAEMVRLSGFQNFLDASVDYLRPYLYFVVAREALNRRGFRPEIALYWLLAAWGLSALIGLMQARNLLGVRGWSYMFYNQYYAERVMEGPSQPWQAKGVTPHANTMAHTMCLGLALIAGFAWNRKLKWYEGVVGLLMAAALLATYSRSGMIVLVAMAFAYVIFLIARKRYQLAFISLFTSGVLLVLGISAVYAFNVERFKPLIEGEGPVKSYEKLGSFRSRMTNAQKAITVGAKSPMFGTQPVGSIINNLRAVTYNAYAFKGKLDNTYTLAWVWFGAVGIGFIIVFLGLLLRPVFLKYGGSSFDVTAFLMGISYLLHFMTENLLFLPTAMVPLVVLALIRARYKLPDSKAPETAPVAKTSAPVL